MARILPFILNYRFPKCSICNKPVERKTPKTDGNGKAVHEDCYLRITRLKLIRPNS